MRKRNIVLLAGAAVVLTGIIAASTISIRVRHRDGKGSQELTTARKEETGEDGETADKSLPEEKKEVVDVHGIGYLYYLDPEAEQTFKEELTEFLEAAGIEASSARVLEDHEDDRSDEKEPALFYLKLDDENETIVQAAFEKTSGRYGFAVSGSGVWSGAGDEEDQQEGRTEHAIPESSEDEEVPEVPVTITDTDHFLTGTVDEKLLGTALAEYLRSIDEGRRDLYVSSFRVTEKGYEAVLDFETVRHDGRNIEVRYDGTYHFRLV